MKQKIGFVGGGRITRIFLEGWNRDGQSLDNITISDSSGELLEKLKGRFPEVVRPSSIQDSSLMR